MNTHQQAKAPFPFIWKTSKVQIIMAIISVVAGLSYYIYSKEPFSVQWNRWLNTFITGATLTLAIAIWFNEKRQEWKKQLSKKLDIYYMLDGKICATVKNAPLTGEGDIRQWGQSIGQTILNKKVSIDFTGFKTESLGLDKKRKVMRYQLVVYLLKGIEGITNENPYEFSEDGNFIPPVQEQKIVQTA
jgi:hypothetical protein